MYGTIEKSKAENGIIKASHNLWYFAHGNTIAEALVSRIGRVMTEEKSFEECLAYHKAKNEKKVGWTGGKENGNQCTGKQRAEAQSTQTNQRHR